MQMLHQISMSLNHVTDIKMGYKIINTIDIDSINFDSLTTKRDTVRYSLDGSKFIIEGESINDYTQEEMYNIIQSYEWRNETIKE